MGIKETIFGGGYSHMGIKKNILGGDIPKWELMESCFQKQKDLQINYFGRSQVAKNNKNKCFTDYGFLFWLLFCFSWIPINPLFKIGGNKLFRKIFVCYVF